ncbi:FAD binding domain-containing protein [Chitinophaga flava]|uniref:Monooxygenase n=1 Tax=Chitinophaga flava TaxID=2259036 RepID=A0A365Y6L0_9BACT|nr:FAD-dependent monooxygenase [Chitinophaga flava]RBL94149.1 monooxygenase [Chitinophaga flava]
MKIIIIGGSIGGLSAGIALDCKGYDVEIYERSAGRMQDRGAGLVIQPDMIDYLQEHRIAAKEIFGIPAYERQVLNSNGHPSYTFKNDTSFTSWNYIWQQLKDYFPENRYFFGHQLEKIEEKDNQVTVTFANGVEKTADLVVGADGYSSVTRAHFLPESVPAYAGYVAYRGLIPESKMTDEEIAFFENKFSIYPYQHSHLLCYLVPGTKGELNRGQRLYNWVWYLNKSEQQLNEILTDKDGKKRLYAVPPAFLSNKSINDLHQLANEELPAILRDRVLQTENPFVQVIVDLAVPQMYSGRIVLLGDAAFVVRPHTASGTAKAYRDAIALADSLYYHKDDIDSALPHWNELQIREASHLIQYGKQLALRSGLGG